MKLNKPNKKQKTLIEEFKKHISFWIDTNDIKSPTHRSDIDQELMNLEFSENIPQEKVDELRILLNNMLTLIQDCSTEDCKKEDVDDSIITVDFNIKKGARVKAIFVEDEKISNKFSCDNKNIKKYLKENEEYVVDYVSAGNLKSCAYLKEFPGIPFNLSFLKEV